MAQDGKKLVVVDDLGYGFCSKLLRWSPFLCREQDALGLGLTTNSVKQACEMLRHEPELKQAICQYLENTWILIKSSHWLSPDTGDLIGFLRECGAEERTIVVVSGESLRTGFISPSDHPGIKLSKTVSWERTFDDFQGALTEGKLDSLLPARHIIVRFGLEGALYFERHLSLGPGLSSGATPGVSSSAGGTLRLFFDPERIEGEYAPTSRYGEFPGITTAFVSGLVPAICRHLNSSDSQQELSRAIGHGISFALQFARRYFDLGYGPSTDTVRKFEFLQLPVTQIFGHAPIDVCRNKGHHHFREYRLDIPSLAPKRDNEIQRLEIVDKPDEYWSILTRQLQLKSLPVSAGRPGGVSPTQSAAAGRGRVALSWRATLLRSVLKRQLLKVG